MKNGVMNVQDPSRPSSTGSITRTSRDNFVNEFEQLPVETDNSIDEDVLEVNDSQNGESHLPKNEESIDPKIRKGLKEIKKLDKLITEKSALEKEAKRERRTFEKNFQKEVQLLVENRGNINGSQQLLALCRGCNTPVSDDNGEAIIPIFATQVVETFDENEKIKEEIIAEDINSKQSKKIKNFLKRNIELASRAHEVIALTEDEEKRLTELLADDKDLFLFDNPFSAPSTASNHYEHSDENKNALIEIDNKLKDLLGEDNDEASFHEIDVVNDTNIEVNCGEEILQSKIDERVLQQRLNDIEVKLSLLSKESDEVIDQGILRRLLDGDSRLTSRSVSICESVFSESDFNSESVCSVDHLESHKVSLGCYSETDS